jgi:hypothetical protein
MPATSSVPSARRRRQLLLTPRKIPDPGRATTALPLRDLATTQKSRWFPSIPIDRLASNARKVLGPTAKRAPRRLVEGPHPPRRTTMASLVATRWALIPMFILAGLGTEASAQTYTSFDADPHATFPHRIDATGRIAGTVLSAGQVYDGFVRNADGSIVLVSVPGSISTDFVTLAGAGRIAGRFSDSSYAEHGFIGLVGGPYSTFDVPGAKSTSPTAANSFGEITGVWSDSAGVQHGFMRAASGAVTTLDAPGAKATSPGDIDSSGDVAGLFTDALGVTHGFIRSAGGTYTRFELPAGASGAWLYMNDALQVAGSYHDATGVYRGFLRDTNGTLTTFALPGTQTYVNDISQGGVVVGQYGSHGTAHLGFLRRPDGTTVTINVPGATLTTSADCISETGAIAGHYQVSKTNTVDHGFVVTGVR